MEVKMKNRILIFAISLSLLPASYSYSVWINWGVGQNPIFGAEGASGEVLQDGSIVQLIWDRDRDGIDPPGYECLPSAGDSLIATSTIGHGSFLPGSFSENTHATMLASGDWVYVRAWNGTTHSEVTHFGDTRFHIPSLWAISSDFSVRLDATQNANWGTQIEWTFTPESDILTQTYKFGLFQNYPNPFRQLTTLSFTIPGSLTYTLGEFGGSVAMATERNRVNLSVYNMSGTLVKSLMDGNHEPGYYRIKWEGRDNQEQDIPPGNYHYILKVDEKTALKKTVLMR
jgi:hypothetical protein